jgi:hypothetical protein
MSVRYSVLDPRRTEGWGSYGGSVSAGAAGSSWRQRFTVGAHGASTGGTSVAMTCCIECRADAPACRPECPKDHASRAPAMPRARNATVPPSRGRHATSCAARHAPIPDDGASHNRVCRAPHAEAPLPGHTPQPATEPRDARETPLRRGDELSQYETVRRLRSSSGSWRGRPRFPAGIPPVGVQRRPKRCYGPGGRRNRRHEDHRHRCLPGRLVAVR